jgi:hypothetical protein
MLSLRSRVVDVVRHRSSTRSHVGHVRLESAGDQRLLTDLRRRRIRSCHSLRSTEMEDARPNIETQQKRTNVDTTTLPIESETSRSVVSQDQRSETVGRVFEKHRHEMLRSEQLLFGRRPTDDHQRQSKWNDQVALSRSLGVSRASSFVSLSCAHDGAFSARF